MCVINSRLLPDEYGRMTPYIAIVIVCWQRARDTGYIYEVGLGLLGIGMCLTFWH